MFRTGKFSGDRSRLFRPASILSTAFVLKEGGSAVEGDFWSASVLSSLDAVDVFALSLAFSSTSSLVFDLTEVPAIIFLVGDCIFFRIFSLVCI